MSLYQLTELNIYPVKSLRGISVSSAEITSRGFKNDRRWMLIDAESRFVTQRKYASLSMVDVSLVAEGIRLNAPGMDAITLPLGMDEGEEVSVRVWNDTCTALLADRGFNEWISRYLSADIRMVYMPDSTQRAVDRDYHVSSNDIVSFADGFPFLLISQSSLDDLNQRLQQKQVAPLAMKRFRPNIVVSGCKPYEEDDWKQFKIGDQIFHAVKSCSRCIVTTIDYQNGTRGTEPLATLKEYRQRNNKVYFGMNVIHQGESGSGVTLETGQMLEVIES